MARIPRETVDAIRDRTDIVEVVGRHVQLQRRGSSWVGLCPFHEDRKPSFYVVPQKALYHCFACQASGDVFKFLMEIEGLAFPEAVRELAGPAGVHIEERELTRAEREALKRRATIYDVLEEAASFFESRLWTAPDGAVARDYLQRRAMEPELARSARLGWAPGGWTTLVDHLHRKGFDARLVEEAGLAKPRDRGGHYDTFRERVIIPIRDDRSRVIAFGGRLLEGDGPKYINSPETRLYDKSQVLYGLDMARRTIGQRDRVILVEGYFDVLSMHQAGFSETVATCGTSLTEAHVSRLRRLSRNLVVLLDADEAGAKAAARTLPLVRSAGIQATRLQLPDAKDPDDLIREEGPEAMERALELTEPLFRWVAVRTVKEHGYTAAGKRRTFEELAEMLGGLDAAEVAELAPLLRVDETTVREWSRAFRPVAPRGPEEPPPPEFLEETVASWKPHRDVVHLLWLLVHRYAEVADLLMRVDPVVLDDHAPVKPVFARLVSGETVASVLDEVGDPSVRRTLAAVVARGRLYEPDQAAAAAVEILTRLDRPLHEARIQALLESVRAASREGRPDDARSALVELQDLRRVAKDLDAARRRGDLHGALDLLGWSAPRNAEE